MTERDERALREALRGLETLDPVDPAAARRGAAERRRNRQALVGIVTVLVLVVGVVGLPRLLYGGGTQSASSGQAEAGAEQAPASGPVSEGGATQQDGTETRQLEPQAESAPENWRTEYYRDISFRVPASWGYAAPPFSDWCVGNREGQPQADQRRPYVWLSSPVAVAAIACPEPRPTTLLTEHVEALAPGPATDYVEGAVREGDWWIVTRFAGSAVLVVTTKDRTRADRILDSAQVVAGDAPCPPSSPVAGQAATRPDNGTDLSRLGPVDRAVLCQYESADDPADVGLPSLRAVRQLEAQPAQALLDQLTSAPVNRPPCGMARVYIKPDLAVLVRVWIAGESYPVFVNPMSCGAGGGMVGGIDDGTTVRLLTRGACQQLLTPPIAIRSASGDVARNCLR